MVESQAVAGRHGLSSVAACLSTLPCRYATTMQQQISTHLSISVLSLPSRLVLPGNHQPTPDPRFLGPTASRGRRLACNHGRASLGPPCMYIHAVVRSLPARAARRGAGGLDGTLLVDAIAPLGDPSRLPRDQHTDAQILADRSQSCRRLPCSAALDDICHSPSRHVSRSRSSNVTAARCHPSRLVARTPPQAQPQRPRHRLLYARHGVMASG